MTPPDDPRLREEWDLMHELRGSPQLLQRVARASGNELSLQTALRREHPDRLVRGAFALCELRRKAGAKFSRAAEMWFDRKGLEQATSEAVARHKANRFSGAVFDLCCGIGGDSLALAERCTVTAVDLNPLACLRTRWNADVYGVSAKIALLCRDATEIDPGQALVHIDPDRRVETTGRSVRVEDYVPGLETLQHMARTFRGGAIKLSPAANFGGKFRDAEVELVSLEGECKEATVWYGELRGSASWRATVLPSGETLAGEPLSDAAELSDPLHYIYDPDPAVVRAGLVDVAAVRLGLCRLDSAEEYLTGSHLVSSEFVQAFEIIAELPNNLVEIRRFFRTADIGQVEIKCRHIPIDAELVRRRLPLEGDRPGVIIFARLAGKSRALVCRRAVSS
ncbi:MAG TPA: class I SAM-dependent methyltransferase [Planctomycetaceae bacterium]|nr:class I SAM-dependent methyltransferase [Planctomycetaceae bacterium]